MLKVLHGTIDVNKEACLLKVYWKHVDKRQMYSEIGHMTENSIKCFAYVMLSLKQLPLESINEQLNEVESLKSLDGQWLKCCVLNVEKTVNIIIIMHTNKSCSSKLSWKMNMFYTDSNPFVPCLIWGQLPTDITWVGSPHPFLRGSVFVFQLEPLIAVANSAFIPQPSGSV